MKENKFNLEDLPRQHPFTVPEGYFDKLPTQVMQRVSPALPETVTPVAWFRQFRTLTAGAVMAVVFLLAFFVPQYFDFTTASPGQSLAQVTDQDITHYLLTKVDLETAQLAEVATLNPPQALEFIEVSPEDVPVDAAMEVLQDESLPQSYE
ncbi:MULTISPECIES: hypothetical protein [Rufibacter]|uniref:Uncharacterized protein n=1 Tax=Rufibacter quisquiliarum TaxID=1549639 RepID=A0A839H1I5_9BACT|nr:MULTISPECIES: hypothetical protein [Rufibacter]MBA9079751.1 hypothetical protein [Rufibacter quisquiliarum]